VRVAGGLVARAAAQVMAEVLEAQRVEAEEAAHRLAAQGALGPGLDGMPPLLRDPLGTS
jgi:hypothetical protein